MLMKKAIMMNKDDNVATVLEGIKRGETIAVVSTDNKVIKNMEAGEEIAAGHKIAVDSISKEETVLKYGESIGTAADRIDKGMHVHVHNVRSKVKYGG
jgi:altronate dehydratase small subunit